MPPTPVPAMPSPPPGALGMPPFPAGLPGMSPSGGEPWWQYLVLLLPLAIPLLLGTVFKLRKRRAVRALNRRLRPGQTVVTCGGLHAVITSLDERTVTLESGPGITQIHERSSVVCVHDQPAPAVAGVSAVTVSGFSRLFCRML
ncbi:preprotein translocase subunit YajC [Nocardia aurantia]|uniref:Preprotein translocase subunit YajC n=1 Tax=Nocardia aurantia TaxID=2585199 RepID=A0A7K0DPL2_9NOCA|nr:hypothetical protein [Nocardia aurantia]